jgi:antitoxin HigA-1
VNENRSVSPEMALKLGRLFGNGTAVWMNMQTAFDLWAVEHDPASGRAARRVEPVHVA